MMLATLLLKMSKNDMERFKRQYGKDLIGFRMNPEAKYDENGEMNLVIPLYIEPDQTVTVNVMGRRRVPIGKVIDAVALL